MNEISTFFPLKKWLLDLMSQIFATSLSKGYHCEWFILSIKWMVAKNYIYISSKNYVYISSKNYVYISSKNYVYISCKNYVYISSKNYVYISCKNYVYISSKQAESSLLLSCILVSIIFQYHTIYDFIDKIILISVQWEPDTSGIEKRLSDLCFYFKQLNEHET